MKILICGISAILAAVLMTVPFDARGNSSDPDDAAGQREYPDIVAHTPSPPESATGDRSAEREAPQLAAEPRRQPTLAPQQQQQPREADGDWQVVRQRRPESDQRASVADRDQLARAKKLEREAFLEQQTRELEEFLQLQERQLDQLLTQQDRELQEFIARQEHASAAPGQQRDVQYQEPARLPAYDDQLARDRAVPQSYGTDVAPVPDPYPDAGPYDVRSSGEPPADSYPTEDRYVPLRRDTIEIPLPGRRTLRFRLP